MTAVRAPEVGVASPAEHVAARRRGLVALFGIASFVAAGLVFLVQPMVARMVLPLLGGTPAVWNTSMVFFQAALLGGYAYAHFSIRALGVRRQSWLHLLLLALPLLLLPIALPVGWTPPTEGSPALWLLVVLAVAVGAPFFAVSTASPVLQRWLSVTDHPAARDPYFLYAAGNLGSMLGLLAYPFLLERWLDVPAQAWFWAAGYVVMLGLVGACAWVALRRAGDRASRAPEPVAPTGSQAAPVTGMRKARWVLLAFVPSSLMLAVTAYLSTDIAAVPLLWVIPLALYLVTFVVTFSAYAPRVVAVCHVAFPLILLAVNASATMLITLPPSSERWPLAVPICSTCASTWLPRPRRS